MFTLTVNLLELEPYRSFSQLDDIPDIINDAEHASLSDLIRLRELIHHYMIDSQDLYAVLNELTEKVRSVEADLK